MLVCLYYYCQASRNQKAHIYKRQICTFLILSVKRFCIMDPFYHKLFPVNVLQMLSSVHFLILRRESPADSFLCPFVKYSIILFPECFSSSEFPRIFVTPLLTHEKLAGDTFFARGESHSFTTMSGPTMEQ